MRCVKTINFYVLINWHPEKKSKPTHGLRQGGPISPYLFLIVSEVFSRLIYGAVDGGFLNGIQISLNDLIIYHLLFANDTLIFLKASPTNCQNIVHLLDTYCSVSEQEVSMQKTSAFFGTNVPYQTRQPLFTMNPIVGHFSPLLIWSRLRRLRQFSEIPIEGGDWGDRLIWPAGRRGKCTIKSGYH